MKLAGLIIAVILFSSTAEAQLKKPGLSANHSPIRELMKTFGKMLNADSMQQALLDFRCETCSKYVNVEDQNTCRQKFCYDTSVSAAVSADATTKREMMTRFMAKLNEKTSFMPQRHIIAQLTDIVCAICVEKTGKARKDCRTKYCV